MARIGLTRKHASLSQPARLVVAIAYLALLLGLGRYLNDGLPPFGIAGLWFYSAFGALILGEFITEPFFTRPADALANGIALVLASASISLTGIEISHDTAVRGRIAFLIYGALIVALAATAIIFKDRGGRLGRSASASLDLTSPFGQARWMFSLLLFGAGYAAFGESAGKVAALYIAWIAIFVLAPLETAWSLYQARRAATTPQTVGVVERIEDPSVVVARLPRGAAVEMGAVATVGSSGAEGIVVDRTDLMAEPRVRVALPRGVVVARGESVRIRNRADGNRVVGFVTDGTTLTDVRVDTPVAGVDIGLAEGRLLEVAIGDREALYQITQAVIASAPGETLSRDKIMVSARKLGTWSPERDTFAMTPWIPAPGAAARLLGSVETTTFVPANIGHVPHTNYGVRINVDLAVTHNTAVLGILGIGKTHLVWELIKRMLVNDTKVVVLDITGQYSERFDPICGPVIEQAIAQDLEDKSIANLESRKVRDDQAGNFVEFRQHLNELLEHFMEGDERLFILNPSRFEVSRMVGGAYDGKANRMTRLSMVEVTQLVAEGLLDIVKSDFTDKARVCLVLEEAHSLIPEWRSTVTDGESAAATGTARAIMQGRKYGFGCLISTQRTANVTKSILNQCNTIFALRIYDATGMGFLENYVGPVHAQLLASLPPRHAVVFGHASSCDAPIIVRLNDSDAFDSGFWTDRRDEIPTTTAPSTPASAPPTASPASTDDDDDIPF
jgi:hypothetical protein